MKNSKKLVMLSLILALPFFVTGCWDRKEIENRGYVLGVAVDYANRDSSRQSDLNHTTQAAGTQLYHLTVELPKFRREEESTQKRSSQSHFIWSGDGESMFAITRSINAQLYFGLFYEDIQIIVFSQEVAENGIRDILDFFLRDAEMRRRSRLFVAPGRAEEILTTKLQVEEANSLFISKIPQNSDKTPFFPGKAELGQISQAMRNKRSFAMPMIFIEGQNVKLNKAAVFNTEQRMVGELTELEVAGSKILREDLKEGLTVVPNPANPDKIVVFELYDSAIHVNSHLENGQLRFTVDAEFGGTLGENGEHRQNALDPEFNHAVEQAVAEELTREVYAAYRKQQALKADVCYLGGLVYRQHPQYWKKIKDHWDAEVFPTVPLDVNIRVTIFRPVNMT